MKTVQVVAYLRNNNIFVHGVYNRPVDAGNAYEAAKAIPGSSHHVIATEPLVSLFVDAPEDSGMGELTDND